MTEETEFEKKYISDSKNKVNPDVSKIKLTDDAYALGELLEKIFVQLFRGNNNGR